MSEPASANRPPKRLEWISRALIESALILLGILGGLAGNEWKESRDRAARVRVVLEAVDSELRANLQLLEEANAYDAGVVTKLRALAADHATSIPAGTYPKGLLIRPPLLSAAWTSAQSTALVNDLPVDLLLVLGRAYETQQEYMGSTAQLLATLYSMALQPTSDDLTADPGRLGGVLSDFAARERRVISRYRDALELLANSRREAPSVPQPAPAKTETPPAGH